MSEFYCINPFGDKWLLAQEKLKVFSTLTLQELSKRKIKTTGVVGRLALLMSSSSSWTGVIGDGTTKPGTLSCQSKFKPNTFDNKSAVSLETKYSNSRPIIIRNKDKNFTPEEYKGTDLKLFQTCQYINYHSLISYRISVCALHINPAYNYSYWYYLCMQL